LKVGIVFLNNDAMQKGQGIYLVTTGS